MSDGPPPASAADGVRPATAQASPPHHRADVGRLLLGSLLVLGGAAVALLACAFALHQLESVDFWWQLRLGRYITELREVPTRDVFTYPAKGHPYIDSHWLFQVGLWRTYLAGGTNGTILAAAALALLTWVCAAARMRGARAPGIGLLALTLGVVAASERYMPRPDLVTLFFLALTCLLVTRYRRHGGRGVLALPLVHLLWVNTHGLWILGPIVIVAYAAGDWVAPRLPLPEGWKRHAMPPARCHALGLVLLLMLPLTFLTPQPLKQALYPFTLFREIHAAGDWVATSVTELAAPLAEATWPVSTQAFVALLGVVALGFVVNFRRLDPVALALTLAFAYLALTARRNMALFAVVAAPFAAWEWGLALEGKGRARPGAVATRAQLLAGLIAVALAVGGAWGAATNTFARRDGSLTRFGLGLRATQYPGRVGDFLTATQAPGPLWNTPELGGYLAWRFWPEREVFIDGRWEVYGPLLLRQYAQTIGNMNAWDHTADRYGVRTVLINHRRPDYGALLRHLYASPQWVFCYADPVAAVFVRRAPDTAAYLAAYAAPLRADALPTPLPEGRVVVWEDAFRDRPHFTRVAAWLAQWPPRPRDGDEAALLGNLCFTLEEDAAAAEWFTRALAADPDNYAAHVSLGYLAQQGGDPAAAAAHYAAARRVRRGAVPEPAPVQ